LVDPAPFAAVARCDSVVVDPHKHGLQPYGCGAVLFADPAVGRLYRHDSPYTYFTSGELHLGEISLECSRAGAAAAALWLTLQAFPPIPGDGPAAASRRPGSVWLMGATPTEIPGPEPVPGPDPAPDPLPDPEPLPEPEPVPPGPQRAGRV